MKVKRFLKEHLLAILTSSFLLFYAIYNTYTYYQFTLDKIRILGINFYKIFETILIDSEAEYPVQLYDYLISHVEGGYLDSIIPAEITDFGYRILYSFRVIVANGYIKNVWNVIVSYLKDLPLLFIILTLLIPMIYILNINVFEYREFQYNKVSKSAKNWDVFYKKICLPVYRFIKARIISIIDKKYVHQIFILSIILYFNFPNIIFDFLSYYFYFLGKFDFLALWEMIVMIFVDLTPSLIKIPLWVYLVSIYIYFRHWRLSLAEDILNHHDAINCGFIKGTGVLIQVNGPPGAGKTKLQTDMAITTEMMFRQMAKEIMDETRNLFPQFGWDLLRKKLDFAIKHKLIANLTEVKDYVNQKILNNYSPGRCNYFNDGIFMGYDTKKYDLFYDNGLKHESLFDCIYDYSQAYFVYQSDFALLTSNYPIRVEHTMMKNDHMVYWNYDWFKKECYDICPPEYSKIVDYDMFRLKKKKDIDNDNAYISIAYVFAFTELGKERPNTLESKEMKKNVEEANPKNDGFVDMLRVSRHPATIRNRTFIKILFDEQRASSCGIALSGITEDILTIDRKQTQKKNAMKFYFIELFLLSVIMNISSSFLSRYEGVRNDRNLLTTFMMWLAKWSHRSYIQYINRYGYEVIHFYRQNGSLPDGVESDTKSDKYYLAYRKIYADRYASDYLRPYFEDLNSQSEKGIGDLPTYEGRYPLWDTEMQCQNSYMVDDYNKNLLIPRTKTCDTDKP